MSDSLHVVWNPASGAKSAGQILDSVVKPLLSSANITTVEHQTQKSGDGVRVGTQLRRILDGLDGSQDVLLLGGDGTTHEVLDGLYGDGQERSPSAQRISTVRFIIVPTGTANALYSAIYPPSSQDVAGHAEVSKGDEWRLRSLRSYLASRQKTGESQPSSASSALYPLTITSTTVSEAYGRARSITAHLITSHALHAAILYDSEQLRDSHPGVERFKIAAAQNVTRWVDGTFKLKPAQVSGTDAGHIQRFDPASRKFIEVTAEAADIKGPFLYVICSTVDRLEPDFVPSPFAAPKVDGGNATSEETLCRPLAALDVVILRPTLDPLVRHHLRSHEVSKDHSNLWDSQASLPARQAFAESRATPLTQAMYDKGRHVFLRYPDVGDNVSVDEAAADLSEGSKGPAMIEYYRCGGYEWLPSPHSARAPLTCIDGTLVESHKTQVRVRDDLAGTIFAWR